MSRFIYIASDYQLNEIDLNRFIKLKVRDIKKKNLTSQTRAFFDDLDDDVEVLYADEEDIDRLRIVSANASCLDDYTNKTYAYFLEGYMNDTWKNEFEEYLSKNLKKDSVIELWSLWDGIDPADPPEAIPKRQFKFSDFNRIDFEILDRRDSCICISFE